MTCKCLKACQKFLSTLSLRRATGPKLGQLFRALISIHALLAESDGSPDHRAADPRDFYPRSPCGERHALPGWLTAGPVISIHALLAESDKVNPLILTNLVLFLSTLSLRRATGKSNKLAGLELVFLSTLSLRRATAHDAKGPGRVFYFYPRSPCGERPGTTSAGKRRWDFYPRSPCGERHNKTTQRAE